MPDQDAKPLTYAQFLKHILPPERIAQESVCHHVGEQVGILDLRELLIERLRHSRAAGPELRSSRISASTNGCPSENPVN